MELEPQMQSFANKFVANTNRNIFLTGKAGTGKTTFLYRLQEQTKKQMAVVAPTGVAAINAGGTTIHSFFQLPLAPFIPTAEGKKDLIAKLKMQRHHRRTIRELELLVIDEVSMVRADVLDAIDTILRHVRQRIYEPFGGVQMIFIGDMHQLSPVAKDEEWSLLSNFYEGIYFFYSKVIMEQKLIYIEFDKVFRQSDINFISLLNNIRNNSLTENDFHILDKCYNPNFIPTKDENYITLTTHNYKADSINTSELAKIKSKSKFFKAIVKGTFYENAYPVDENLELKVGAKVMFLKNDTESPRRFYNGKIGEIVAFGNEYISVQCPDDDFKIDVTPMEWNNIRYTANEQTQKIDEEILGVFQQYPLRLAWAITIHKSQGLTFDKAIIDVESAFTSGQVYVALSRCRSLEGMVLLSPINKQSIRNDKSIINFSKQKNDLSQLKDKLQSSEHDYFIQILTNIFEFRQATYQAKQLLKIGTEYETILGGDAIIFANELILQLSEIEAVGNKFQSQLKAICLTNPFDKQHLKERLQLASKYFTEKIILASKKLEELPISIDNKQVAKEYDDALHEIYLICEQKKIIINDIKNEFSIDKYYSIKNSLSIPKCKISSNSSQSSNRNIKSSHPHLVAQLFEIRNYIASDSNVPVYVVANSQTIMEMAEYLPQNKKELLRINGFGEVKYEKYGEDFLNCIRDYCIMNNLQSNIHNAVKKERKPKKEKALKGSSSKESLNLYLKGTEIENIANQRSLTVKTIAGHLSKYVLDGTLKISDFISAEKLNQIRQIIKTQNPTDGSIYVALKNKFTDVERTIGWAYVVNENAKR